MLKDDAPPDKRMRLDLRRAVTFVNEIITQTASVDRMTSEPQPGFKRRSASEAGSGIYTDLLARQAAFNRRPTQAEGFINQYESWKRRQHHARGGTLDAGVEVLTTQMIVAAKNFRWTDVDKLWCMTLQRGLEASTP
ncbi:MAG: hypothetical protein M1823_008381, partial [Watsoniomyces obsoletus]